MAYRYDEFAPGEVYHIFTRGVEKREIFMDDINRSRFINLLLHCMPRGPIRSYSIAKRLGQKPKRTAPGKGLIDLLCYCLMSNHIHLLVHENVEGGISLYMQRLLNSYAKYFNARYERSGSLFTNPFRAVLVDQDEQLLHVARYIHLNPFVARTIENPLSYKWYSLTEYIRPSPYPRCHRHIITGMLKPEEHRVFVEDEAEYARSLHYIQHLLID